MEMLLEVIKEMAIIIAIYLLCAWAITGMIKDLMKSFVEDVRETIKKQWRDDK